MNGVKQRYGKSSSLVIAATFGDIWDKGSHRSDRGLIGNFIKNVLPLTSLMVLVVGCG